MKMYKKATVTIARKLTEQDWKDRSGVILSREGPKNFHVGDYVAKDMLGEWKIKAAVMEESYRQISMPNAEGWMQFERKNPYEWAEQQEGYFETNGLQGQPGDYLVWNFERTHSWVVAKEVYEGSRIEVS